MSDVPSWLRRRHGLQRQIDSLNKLIVGEERLSSRLSLARLALFLFGFLLTAVLFFTSGPGAALSALPVWFLPFLVAVFVDRRLQRTLSRHATYRAIKVRHMATLDLDWEKMPAARSAAPDPSHPFALDLDIQGKHSLHRLLDNTVTPEASERLLSWLLELNPEPAEVMRRQALVQQLTPMSAFRDKLSLNTMSATAPDAPLAAPLVAWLQRSTPLAGVWLLILLCLLGAATIVFFALAMLRGLQPIWIASLAAYFALYGLFGRGSGALFHQSLELRGALEQMESVFSFLENRRFGSNQALVRDLCAPFASEKERPSRYVTRLQRIITAAGLSRNPVLWLLLNLVFPWDLFFSLQLRRLRGELALRAPAWLDVLFELEAAGSLAALHYLNPHYSLPSFLDEDAIPPFAGQSLGHPLIAEDAKVCNDFTLLELGDLVLITGSNMSGKSTFLRTLGVNLCLAYAGGPVNAAQLHTRYFRLFTSVRMSDSVTDGISYFYAEVKRLKALLTEVYRDDPRPVFFLIDEIFRGTNNRERLIGSSAYIHALIDGNGLGVVSTHDLELVSLAEEHQSIINYHFRDSIADDRMVFDYCLRPGPCPTTNALKIMRHEGLPVDGGLLIDFG